MASPRNQSVKPRVNTPPKNVARNNHPQNNAGQHIASNGRGTSARPSPAIRPHVASNSGSYGVGSSARHYTARGYGRGYHNRYVGYRNYGRSQQNARSIVARLRSVHSGLARIDHDYQGHRVRAMHHIARAINMLSHRSVYASRNGINGSNPRGLASGVGRSINRGGNLRLASNNRQPLTQLQSDQRMNQALRTTQGIALQLTHQGSYSSNHVRARGYLQRSLHEMNLALSVR